MPIVWRKYSKTPECYKEIIAKVGFLENGRKANERLSETNYFIVMCKFERSNDPFEPHLAHLLNYSDLTPEGKKPDSYNISVNGMSGKIEISHWSEINRPYESKTCYKGRKVEFDDINKHGFVFKNTGVVVSDNLRNGQFLLVETATEHCRVNIASVKFLS